MLLDDHVLALHLLQQMGPATDSLAPIPHRLPFSSIREAAILTAEISTDVLAAAAEVAAVRTRQVAELTTTAVGYEVHATEEEAAQAAQVATGAALTVAQAAIAEADATTPSALLRGIRQKSQDNSAFFFLFQAPDSSVFPL